MLFVNNNNNNNNSSSSSDDKGNVDTCKEQGTVRSTGGTYYYECRCYDDNNDNNHENLI